MKCSIDTQRLKIWGRVIHSLSLIGETLIQFQFTREGLIVTTGNGDYQICARVIFNKEFFINYWYDTRNAACKVPVKCVLKPFRSLRFLTKCTTSCDLVYCEGQDKLKVILHCKFGGTLQYSIPLDEDQSIHQDDIADQLDRFKYLINAEAKHIITSLSNFSHGKGVADLTIKATRDRVYMKNCTTDLVRKDGKIYTEIIVNPADFTEYDVREDCELTFGMREFKIFVTFAESMKLPVALHFNSTQIGPVVATAISEDSYYATLTIMPGQPSRPHLDRESSVASNPFTTSANITGVTSNRNVPIANHTAQNVVGSDCSHVPEHNTEQTLNSRSNRLIQRPTRSSPSTNAESVYSQFRPLLFPNVGYQFAAVQEIPGQDDVLLRSSDEEEDL